MYTRGLALALSATLLVNLPVSSEGRFAILIFVFENFDLGGMTMSVSVFATSVNVGKEVAEE